MARYLFIENHFGFYCCVDLFGWPRSVGCFQIKSHLSGSQSIVAANHWLDIMAVDIVLAATYTTRLAPSLSI